MKGYFWLRVRRWFLVSREAVVAAKKLRKTRSRKKETITEITPEKSSRKVQKPWQKEPEIRDPCGKASFFPGKS